MKFSVRYNPIRNFKPRSHYNQSVKDPVRVNINLKPVSFKVSTH